MKQKLILILFLGIISINVKSQSNFIIAGQYDSSFTYSPLYVSFHVGVIGPSIDVDGDTLIDISITGSSAWNAMVFYYDAWTLLNPVCGEILNSSNYIAYLNQGDTIRNSSKWTTSNQVRLMDYTISTYPGQEDTGYANCSINNKYFGYRKFVENDTLYSWIKVGSDNCTMTFFDCAMQKRHNSNIEVIKFQPEYSIYPNPFNDYIVIENIKDNELIEITDIKGQKLNYKITNGKKNSKNVNFPSLLKGIYILKLNSERKIYTYKLIRL